MKITSRNISKQVVWYHGYFSRSAFYENNQIQSMYAHSSITLTATCPKKFVSCRWVYSALKYSEQRKFDWSTVASLILSDWRAIVLNRTRWTITMRKITNHRILLEEEECLTARRVSEFVQVNRIRQWERRTHESITELRVNLNRTRLTQINKEKLKR